MLPIILGQAPSRLGDGRSFTGPSGEVLISWFGVSSREELLEYFQLENLLATPLTKHAPRAAGEHNNKHKDTFTKEMGRTAANSFIVKIEESVINHHGVTGADVWWEHNFVTVVTLGLKVWESFGLSGASQMFSTKWSTNYHFQFCRFPHPSGLNHQRNDRALMAQTSAILRTIGTLGSAPQSLTTDRASRKSS